MMKKKHHDFALYFIILLISLSTKSLYAECNSNLDIATEEVLSTIDDGQLVVDELIGDNLGDHTEIGRQCIRYENSFRGEVLEDVESTLEHYSFLEECFNGEEKNAQHRCNIRKDEVDQLFDGLKNYRSNNLKMHTELAKNWLEDLPEGHRQVADRCFNRDSQVMGLSDGSIMRTSGIVFENNVRRLRPQIENVSMCQPVSYLWNSDLDARKREAINTPSIVSMSRDDVGMMAEFENSPANTLLSSNTKDNPNMSDRELRSSFHHDINAMKNSLIEFKNYISNMEDRRLYYLYNFENQYESFTQNLPDEEKEFALSCKNNSGFIKDCITRREIEGRCGSRSWDIAENILPLVSIIDALEGYKEVDVALTSGLYTSQEAAKRRSALTMQFVLGIPLPPGTLIGVRLGGRVAIKQIDDVTARIGTFASEESGAVLLPRLLRETGFRTNRVAVETALKGLEGTAKMGSCKATCDTFVKRVFTRTRNDSAPLRLDIYNTGSTHYHIRTQAGDIIDPTYQQFFNFGRDHVADVFYGSKDDLIREIGRLRQEVGFNERVAGFFSTRSNEEVYEFIWGQANLYRSGSELRYFDDIGETLFD